MTEMKLRLRKVFRTTFGGKDLKILALLFRNRTYFPHSVNSCLAVGEEGSGLLKSFLERDKSRQREYRLVDANWGKKTRNQTGT